MSIESEIERITQNVADTYEVLESAGATMPAEANTDNLSATAQSISAVLYGKSQSLTDDQKERARENIGATACVGYGTCSTAAATAAKVITVSDDQNWVLKAGSIVMVKFTETNTASNPTFNVNGTGAKSVWYSTAVLTTSSLSYAGYASRPAIYMYDGTQYVFLGWSYDANTTYTNVKLGHGYATCSTAAATTAKEATLSSYTLATGGIVAVKFTYAVPASATLNINSKGAKAIYHKNAAIAAGVIKAGDTATFIYSSSKYHLLSVDRVKGETLTFSGGATGTYDGSEAKEIKIPEIPSALKNPYSLTFTGAASATYDGSGAKTVHVPTTDEIVNAVIAALGGSGGTLLGTVDSNNNIILTGNLADGTYTFKYENSDGSTTELGTMKISDGTGDTSKYTDLFVVDDGLLNKRWSNSGGGFTGSSDGYVVSDYIPVTLSQDASNPTLLRVRGATFDGQACIVYYSSSKTLLSGTNAGTVGYGTAPTYATTSTDENGDTCINLGWVSGSFDSKFASAGYIRVGLNYKSGTALTSSNVDEINDAIIVTVDELIED